MKSSLLRTSARVLCAALLLTTAALTQAQDWPTRPVAHPGRLRARRRHRRHGARRGRPAGAAAQAAGGGRKPARRLEHAGGRRHRQVHRRPHHGDGRLDRACDRAAPAQARLRQRQGPGAGGLRRRGAQCAGGQQRAAGRFGGSRWSSWPRKSPASSTTPPAARAARSTSRPNCSRTRTGVFITHIPYRGSGPALIDLIGGQVQMSFDTMPSVIGQIKNGKIKRAGRGERQAQPATAQRADDGRGRRQGRGDERLVRHLHAGVHAQGGAGSRVRRSRPRCWPCPRRKTRLDAIGADLTPMTQAQFAAFHDGREQALRRADRQEEHQAGLTAMNTQQTPVIALTLGDAAGIGPELIARLLSEPGITARRQRRAGRRPVALAGRPGHCRANRRHAGRLRTLAEVRGRADTAFLPSWPSRRSGRSRCSAARRRRRAVRRCCRC